MPARKLRFEQIEELSYDELRSCLEYEAQAVAYNKLAELSDYYGKLIDQFDRAGFEIAIHQQYTLWSKNPGKMLQRDLGKLSFEGILRQIDREQKFMDEWMKSLEKSLTCRAIRAEKLGNVALSASGIDYL